MNYYLDCEFLEGKQKEKFPISLFRKESKQTIDLISIGIVAEDGREYFAVSKDFNLDEAWNRFDWRHDLGSEPQKVYWIRENVLKLIFIELNEKDLKGQVLCLESYEHPIAKPLSEYQVKFSKSRLKDLIFKHGKANKQIAEEVKKFVGSKSNFTESESGRFLLGTDDNTIKSKRGDFVFDNPKFYAYYADYDWVVFCWLFGKMIDLPNGFPMYCIDLKQIFDEKQQEIDKTKSVPRLDLKYSENYPEQENEHDALSDSRFARDLHYFLKSL